MSGACCTCPLKSFSVKGLRMEPGRTFIRTRAYLSAINVEHGHCRIQKLCRTGCIALHGSICGQFSHLAHHFWMNCAKAPCQKYLSQGRRSNRSCCWAGRQFFVRSFLAISVERANSCCWYMLIVSYNPILLARKHSLQGSSSKLFHIFQSATVARRGFIRMKAFRYLRLELMKSHENTNTRGRCIAWPVVVVWPGGSQPSPISAARPMVAASHGLGGKSVECIRKIDEHAINCQLQPGTCRNACEHSTIFN